MCAEFERLVTGIDREKSVCTVVSEAGFELGGGGKEFVHAIPRGEGGSRSTSGTSLPVPGGCRAGVFRGRAPEGRGGGEYNLGEWTPLVMSEKRSTTGRQPTYKNTV